jgi:hypothetical protein
MLHAIQRSAYERVMFAPIWQVAQLNGVRAWIDQPGIGLIDYLPYSWLGYRSQRKGREARELEKAPGSNGNSVGAATTPIRFRRDPKACISGPMSGCATKGRKRYSRIKTGS